jgi:hypothetical protein
MEFETTNGFEHNVFNRHFIDEILDSPYHHTSLKLAWEKKTKKHFFRISGKIYQDIFWKTNNANLRKMELDIYNRIVIRNKSTITISGDILRYHTGRENDQLEVFRLPNSYHRLRGVITFGCRPFKRNNTRIYTTFINKFYDSGTATNTMYKSWGIRLKSTQYFNKSSNFGKYLRLDFDLSQRNYRERINDGETDPDFSPNEETRVWRYLSGELRYAIKIDRNTDVSIVTQFRKRKDLSDDLFGYDQWGSGMQMVHKHKKTQVEIEMKWYKRNYTNQYADTEEEFRLAHTYIGSGLTLEHKLNKKAKLVIRGKFLKRSRNKSPNPSNRFLPYVNANVSFGIHIDI